MKIKSASKVNIYSNQSCCDYVYGKQRGRGNAVYMIENHLNKKYGFNKLHIKIATVQNDLSILMRMIKLKQKQQEILEKRNVKWQI